MLQVDLDLGTSSRRPIGWVVAGGPDGRRHTILAEAMELAAAAIVGGSGEVAANVMPLPLEGVPMCRDEVLVLACVAQRLSEGLPCLMSDVPTLAGRMCEGAPRGRRVHACLSNLRSRGLIGTVGGPGTGEPVSCVAARGGDEVMGLALALSQRLSTARTGAHATV